MTSENNSECTLPTIPTVPTNIGTMPVYDVNNDAPSRIKEMQVEEEFPVMNRMYRPHMNIEQDLL